MTSFSKGHEGVHALSHAIESEGFNLNPSCNNIPAVSLRITLLTRQKVKMLKLLFQHGLGQKVFLSRPSHRRLTAQRCFNFIINQTVYSGSIFLHFKTIFLRFVCVITVIVSPTLSTCKMQMTHNSIQCLNASCVDTRGALLLLPC